MEQSALWTADSYAAGQEISNFEKSKVCYQYHVHESSRTDHIFSQMKPFHIITTCLSDKFQYYSAICVHISKLATPMFNPSTARQSLTSIQNNQSLHYLNQH